MSYLAQMQAFHAQSPETRAIYEALEQQTDKAALRVDEGLAQLNLFTATWALPLWEQAFGLEPDAEKAPQYRRERVMARMRGPGRPTPARMKELAESFTNGAVEVEEYPEQYRFVLCFVSADGVPPHIGDLAEAVEQFKPAHLSFGFMYTYLTHEELSKFTHAQLDIMTHSQITHVYITQSELIQFTHANLSQKTHREIRRTKHA